MVLLQYIDLEEQRIGYGAKGLGDGIAKVHTNRNNIYFRKIESYAPNS